ncbi:MULTISPECIES: transposase family protein [unclassified Kitasatospora]|uniref:transposase family protein n=1 Tax=unclassified Kitasatospora TaxID=2633591 RepID=UPI0038200C66
MPCPMCGRPTGQVHAFHGRVVADVPVDGRRAVAAVRVRRTVCPGRGCPRQTFHEQLPGLIERYQQRTRRLADQLRLAGRPSRRPGRRLPAVREEGPGPGREGGCFYRGEIEPRLRGEWEPGVLR